MPGYDSAFPRKIILTENVDKTTTDILIDVLSAFLNIKELPLNEYGLRVYGCDEFLSDQCKLGSFLFVGKSIASGKDIMLEVGKRLINSNNTETTFTGFDKLIIYFILNFRLVLPQPTLLKSGKLTNDVQKMVGYINCLSKGKGLPIHLVLNYINSDYNIWWLLLDLIKHLRSSMNQTLLQEVEIAIKVIDSKTSVKNYEIEISNLASAIIRQLFVYSRSSYANFSIRTVSLTTNN
jgi:hypothetical protein